MKVRQLTVEQKDALIGQTYDGVQFFNMKWRIQRIKRVKLRYLY